MTKKRDPLLEGKLFEEYAWPTVRRNFPLWEGWHRVEQMTLPSGIRPDNVLYNEETQDAVIVEMKDRAEIKETDVRKVRRYMDEIREMVELRGVRGFLVIAWDTIVHPQVRRLAKQLGMKIRRLEWRR